MATKAPPHLPLFWSLLLILLAISPSGSLAVYVTNHSISLEEASVRDLQHALERNQLTSRQLVEFYLRQIQRLNPILKAVIEVNPEALYLVDKADNERKAKAPGSLAGLHGIPVLVKDNIATKDKLNTMAGSYALLGLVVPRDAGIVRKLRKAGAIIIGMASLSEWANFRSDYAPSGWSGRSGQGKNPYILLANPCGSAISVAANLVVVTVSDAVYVLDEIVVLDYRDKVTIKASLYITRGGYKQFLKANGLRGKGKKRLKGKRLGIVRKPFFDFGDDVVLRTTF
ncbi:hypothetical protein CJ030_MR7G022897 [Morella rubra]|uniref:Amidase domain-containing protein n=1 Tax=Morella rubra TaxID=262757 RepID=A0A6A1V5E8_9ROSI|nr:hypothetical protein CJ030_MR7G022897 [Morella rubra]